MIGERLGAYQIDRELGSGGMGKVYAATVTGRARGLSEGDRAHLEEAKRLLDETLANVPVEHHEAMLTNLRVNREIMAAWNGESGGAEPPPAARDDPDDDEPRGTESVTRVG